MPYSGFIINRSLTLQQQRLFKSFSLFALFYCMHYVLYFLLFLGFQNRNFKEMRKPYSDVNDPRLQWLENDFPTYLRKWKEVVNNRPLVGNVDRKKCSQLRKLKKGFLWRASLLALLSNLH